MFTCMFTCFPRQFEDPFGQKISDQDITNQDISNRDLEQPLKNEMLLPERPKSIHLINNKNTPQSIQLNPIQIKHDVQRSVYKKPTITFSKRIFSKNEESGLFVEIKTERLTIRTIHYEDLEDFQKLRFDARNTKNFYGGHNFCHAVSEKELDRFIGRAKACNPLGGFSVRTHEGQWLGYFNLDYESRFDIRNVKRHLKVEGIGDHPYWRQGIGQEVAAAIVHYLAALFDPETKPPYVREAYFKSLTYFTVPVPVWKDRQQKVAHILTHIGLKEFGTVSLKDAGRSELYEARVYAAKISELVEKVKNDTFKVEHSRHYTDTIHAIHARRQRHVRFKDDYRMNA